MGEKQAFGVRFVVKIQEKERISCLWQDMGKTLESGKTGAGKGATRYTEKTSRKRYTAQFMEGPIRR